MTKVMDTMLEYLWLADLGTLCIFAALAIKLRQNSSSLMTQAFVVLISGTIIKYQILVNSFVSPETNQTIFTFWVVGLALFDCFIAFAFYMIYQRYKEGIKPALRTAYVLVALILILVIAYTQYVPLFSGSGALYYKLWIITAFYIGGAFIDSFIIYVIYKLHQCNNKTHSLIARMYILAFSVTAIMQILRFNEKYILESNSYKVVYQLGLASINISTSVITLLIACLAIYQFFSNKKRKGLLWNI
jgi:hypothetical protein